MRLPGVDRVGRPTPESFRLEDPVQSASLSTCAMSPSPSEGPIYSFRLAIGVTSLAPLLLVQFEQLKLAPCQSDRERIGTSADNRRLPDRLEQESGSSIVVRAWPVTRTVRRAAIDAHSGSFAFGQRPVPLRDMFFIMTRTTAAPAP